MYAYTASIHTLLLGATSTLWFEPIDRQRVINTTHW